MQISASSVLVIEPFGLPELCGELMKRGPALLTLASRRREEAESAAADLRIRFAEIPASRIQSHGANFFAESPGAAYLSDADSGFSRLLEEARPDIVIDLSGLSGFVGQDLVRRLQSLGQALKAGGVKNYIKLVAGVPAALIACTENPEMKKELLEKAAIYGALTQMLELAGNSAGTPSYRVFGTGQALIAKSIASGEFSVRGRKIPLCDMKPADAQGFGKRFLHEEKNGVVTRDAFLNAVFIDTGEAGSLSESEMAALAAIGPLEVFDSSELVETLLFDIENSVAPPGGAKASWEKAASGRPLVAGRMPGPESGHGSRLLATDAVGRPRLSKLLFESAILKRCAGSIDGVLRTNTVDLAKSAERLISTDNELRSQILSLGICIMIPDGEHYLRGVSVYIPAGDEEANQENINLWCERGWVDLRQKNFAAWHKRLYDLKAAAQPDGGRRQDGREYTDSAGTIDEAKLAAWVLMTESADEFSVL